MSEEEGGAIEEEGATKDIALALISQFQQGESGSREVTKLELL